MKVKTQLSLASLFLRIICATHLDNSIFDLVPGTCEVDERISIC